ncbi:DUF3575 domain-containing protein [Marinifilum fragile]|uniref:DUF3575 domain-containing protein n=1 Tax=Marinifilum fragile TaxID=570161 RepID=UPI002AABD055|nr:DUF3575 domain-containing protein [Marinifilum fragile]
MKNKITLISFILLLSVSFAKAQKTVVKANMLSPLVRTGSFFVEHQLNDNSSLQLGLLYTGKTWDETQIRGWGVTPEYRFYLSDSPAPKGFFVAPYARYLHFELENESHNKAKMNGLGAGLIIGQQYIFKERVSFEWFFGPGYTNIDLDVKSGVEDDFETGSWDGFTLRAGITLGIAF